MRICLCAGQETGCGHNGYGDPYGQQGWGDGEQGWGNGFQLAFTALYGVAIREAVVLVDVRTERV